MKRNQIESDRRSKHSRGTNRVPLNVNTVHIDFYKASAVQHRVLHAVLLLLLLLLDHSRTRWRFEEGFGGGDQARIPTTFNGGTVGTTFRKSGTVQA